VLQLKEGAEIEAKVAGDRSVRVARDRSRDLALEQS